MRATASSSSSPRPTPRRRSTSPARSSVRRTGRANSPVMVPSPNSRPNIQASTTANPPRPPGAGDLRRAEQEARSSRRSPPDPAWPAVAGRSECAASSIEPLSTEMPTTIATDPTRPTVEPASFTTSAQIARPHRAGPLVVEPHGFEERVLDLGGGGVEVADQPAGVHHDDAIGDAGDLVEVVAADQDRRAVARRDAAGSRAAGSRRPGRARWSARRAR